MGKCEQANFEKFKHLWSETQQAGVGKRLASAFIEHFGLTSTSALRQASSKLPKSAIQKLEGNTCVEKVQQMIGVCKCVHEGCMWASTWGVYATCTHMSACILACLHGLFTYPISPLISYLFLIWAGNSASILLRAVLGVYMGPEIEGKPLRGLLRSTTTPESAGVWFQLKYPCCPVLSEAHTLLLSKVRTKA